MSINPNLVPEDFLERISNNPKSIYNDFEIRLAIDTLRIYVRDGTQDESNEAREFLKDANLSGYIDKKSTYTKTYDPNLRHWQTNVPTFLNIISEMKIQAEPIWNKYKYKREKLKSGKKRYRDKEACIREILETMMSIDPVEDFLDSQVIEAIENLRDETVDKVTYELSDSDITNLVLSIFAKTQNITFPSIKKFYYSKEITTAREQLECVEEKYKLGELKLISLNSKEIPTISNEELSENPELALQLYKQKYIKYVENRIPKIKGLSPNFILDLFELAND